MSALSQSEFLQALGWAVLNSLWQMALLWVVYQLVTAVFRITKPSRKANLSTFLLIAGFAWFVFTFGLILSENPGASGYTAFVNVEGNEELYNWLYTTLPIASLVYLLLLILPALNFIRNYRYVQAIRSYGLAKADVQWRMFVQKVSARMGINKPVHVWMSEFVSSPVTIGYLKPIILLPVAAVNHLSAEQMEAVLLHELSHIRRFDYLTNLITRFIQTILYFNPFVKAFARIIERERERSCDEIVMQFQYEPHGYASALLTLEKAGSAGVRTLAVAASGNKRNELLGRIESILGVKKEPIFSFNKLAGVLAGLLCFIALNALLIMSKPGKTISAPFLSQLSSPFFFFTDDNETKANKPGAEIATNQVVNHIPSHAVQIQIKKSAAAATDAMIEDIQPVASEASPMNSLSPMLVSLKEQAIPVLTEQQENQVKEALVASKKVLEEGQWRVVEKNIADAMTTAEKDKLKAVYQRQLAKAADWGKMEDKLRMAYDQIDWNTLNASLNMAVAEIKLDSLQNVYNVAISNLSELKKDLCKNGEKGVPDTDITLKAVEHQISEIQKANNKLKTIRVKKIVKL